MTEHDNELKDLFRQKNMENDFPVDEQNWQKMSSVLKDERNDRKRLLVYFSFLALVLGLSGTWFFVEQRENSNDTLARTTPLSGKTTRIPAVSKRQAEPSEAIPAPKKQNVTALERHQVNEATSPKKSETPFVKPQQSGPTQIKLNTDQQEQETPMHDQAKTKMLAIDKEQFFQTEKETAVLVSSSPVTEKQLSVQSPAVEPADRPEMKGSVPSDQGAHEMRDPEDNAVEIPVTATTATSEEKVIDQNKDDSNSQNMPQKNTVPFSPVLTVAPLRDSIITNVLAKEEDPASKRKLDSAVAVAPVKDSVSPQALPSQRIFLEAGSNYLLGWKTNNRTEGNGLNPLIGLQYQHDVSTKIGLSIGLQYSIISHLGLTSHSSSTTRLKFGEESDVTVISVLNMHYLMMPLKLSYGFSRNDFVCIGYTMGYLLDAESKVEKYSTKLNYSSTPVVSKAMGYTSGFNSFDGQVSVCYRRRLHKEWYISGELFYGLYDIKNNNAYASDEFERVQGFRLSLFINLWKK